MRLIILIGSALLFVYCVNDNFPPESTGLIRTEHFIDSLYVDSFMITIDSVFIDSVHYSKPSIFCYCKAKNISKVTFKQIYIDIGATIYSDSSDSIIINTCGYSDEYYNVLPDQNIYFPINFYPCDLDVFPNYYIKTPFINYVNIYE